MQSIWSVCSAGRCSARCLRMRFSAGFSANVFLIQVAACTALGGQAHLGSACIPQPPTIAVSSLLAVILQQGYHRRVLCRGKCRLAPSHLSACHEVECLRRAEPPSSTLRPGPLHGMHASMHRPPTFQRADLRHERADIAHRQPVAQALAPHQRALVNDAMDPGLAQHAQVAGPPRHAQPVPIVPVLVSISSASAHSVWHACRPCRARSAADNLLGKGGEVGHAAKNTASSHHHLDIKYGSIGQLTRHFWK